MTPSVFEDTRSLHERDRSLAKHLEPWKIFLCAFAAAGVAIAAQLAMARAAVKQAAISHLSEVSRYVSENLTGQMRAVDEALITVARDYSSAALGASSADASRQLLTLTRILRGVKGLAVYDANGAAVASERPEDIGRDFYNESFFTKMRSEPAVRNMQLTPPWSSEGKQGPLHLSRVITDREGRFAGAVSARLNEEFFTFIIRSALFAPDMRASLAHPNGDLFVTHPGLQGERRMNVSPAGSAFEKHVRERHESSVFEGRVTASGKNRLVVLANVLPQNLGFDNAMVLAVSRDQSEVYAPWEAQAQLYFFLYLGVLVIATGVRLIERRRRIRLLIEEEASRTQMRLAVVRLERALDGAELGLWELELQTKMLRVDARGASLLGHPPSEMVLPLREWNQMLNAADRRHNAHAFATYLRGRTPSYESEFRVVSRAGTTMWICSRGKVTQLSGVGTPARVIGTFMDISRRKAGEDALANALLLQRRTGEIAKIGGWTFDLPHGPTTWTDEIYTIHGIDPGEPANLHRVLSLYDEQSQLKLKSAIAAAAKSAEPWNIELRMVCLQGRASWMRARGEAITQNGSVTRLVGTFQDITAAKEAALNLKKLNDKLSELSFQDALTGLGNRRHFDETLAAEWSRSARANTWLAVLMIDVDYFKPYNDLHGHTRGDDCLRLVGAVLKDTLRRSHEKAMRYGGEEFAILLPATTQEGASLVGQRIVDAVRLARIAHGASPINEFVTLSVGVAAVIPSNPMEPTALVELADTALYAAKEQGRDRVVGLQAC